VFIGSADYKLYALDADTGERLWSTELGNKINDTPAIADGTVYSEPSSPSCMPSGSRRTGRFK
jgi:outer membrane protein assembly factor BamB